ncbi:MAG: tRNA lysidine(34) synthetase TilS [Rhodothermia bacterium]|nr:MAG: tRNA lysidine(34) synthetase TilS [Rhodothermia bacterium]
MLDRVQSYVNDHSLFDEDERILVGVSGGVDSVTLAWILFELGYRLEIAHVNYELRGDESDRDAALVRAFSEDRDLVLHEFEPGEMPPGSLQENARKFRYRRFEEIAVERGMNCIAVAHNRNDQAETVLLNLLRGGGFDGVAGMRPFRPARQDSPVRLARPLLDISRSDILAFASSVGLQWREDASNVDVTYSRVKIRQATLPSLESCGRPFLVEELASISKEMQRVVEDVLPEILPTDLQFDRLRDQSIPIASLKGLDPAVRGWYLLRLVRRWLPEAPARRSTVRSLERLMDAPKGKRIEFVPGAVWRESDCIRFVLRKPVTTPSRVGVSDGNEISGCFGRLTWEILPADAVEIRTGRFEIVVDETKISGCLSVRPWLPGDRFKPFGMDGWKKVKSFLTDVKVASSERKSVHVLCDDERIVWILGHRMDNQYRVEDHTERIRQFSFEPAG